MAHSEAHQIRTAVRLPPARACGHSIASAYVRQPNGFTLVEVQIAIVLFVFGMLAFLSTTRVNGALLTSVEGSREIDGYADVTAERAIVFMTGEPGTTGAPPCEVRLESIDDSGAYPIVEITSVRALP